MPCFINDVYEPYCILRGISKSEAINLMQNIDFTEKSRTL